MLTLQVVDSETSPRGYRADHANTMQHGREAISRSLTASAYGRPSQEAQKRHWLDLQPAEMRGSHPTPSK